jgi:hypothetical protein
MFRRFLVFVALVIGLLAITVAGVVAFRLALTEALLSSQLASLGIPARGLTVAAFDLNHLIVSDISLGRDDELRVEAVTLSYSPDGLLAGRLEDITIEGLRLRLDLSGAGPPFGSLQPPLQEKQGAGGGGVALLPSAVILSRGRIEAVTPTGDMAAALSGRWQPLAETATLSLADFALPHLAIETSRLEIDVTRDRITATAQARGQNDALGLDLQATVESWRGEATVVLALDSHLVPAAWNIPPVPTVEAGRMALSLGIEGQLPPIQTAPLDASAVAWLLDANLHGRLRASLTDVDFRDRAQGVTGNLDLSVTVADGDMNIEIAENGRLQIARIDPALLDAIGVPAEASGLRDAGATVSLPLGDAPLRTRLRPTAAGADLAVSGSAEMAMAETTLEVRTDGVLTLSKEYIIKRVSFPQADIRLRRLTLAGHRLEQLHITGAMAGTPDDLKGTADIAADTAAMRIETLAVGAAKIALAAEFDWVDRRLDMRQQGDGSAVVASLGLGEAALIAKPFSTRLANGALTIDLTPDGPAITHALTLRPQRVTVELPRPDATPLEVQATAGTIRAEGGLDPGAPYRGRIAVAGGQYAVPDEAFAAEAVSASFDFPAIVGKRLAKFTAGRLLHTADPAFFTPLRIDGEIARQKNSFVLKAAGAGADGAFRFSLHGRHRTTNGHGTVQIRVPETAFGKDALQPVHLSPLFRDLRDATGRLGAIVEFAWGHKGVESKAVLDLIDLSFVTSDVTVAGLDSQISLDGLLPLSTPPGQKIAVRRVDPALPLDDVEIHFQLEPARSPRLRLEQATARFAGGRLDVAEAVIDLARPRNNLNIGVDNVDLELLLSLLQVEGVAATGRLSGTIPVVVADNGVAIENGQLAAQGPGVLRVQSEAAAAALSGTGEQVALMLSALEDFRYDELSATLDMGIDGDAAVMTHMQGHNPAVLDGYPFAFNTGLSGNLAKLLGAVRQGADLSTGLVNPQTR